MDRWILTRLEETIKIVTVSLDDYQAAAAAEAIEALVEDFSTWHIRRSRDRVGVTAVDLVDKNEAYQTMYFVLVNLAKLLAPFMPYISDYIYITLTGEKSVHLSEWPDEIVMRSLLAVRPGDSSPDEVIGQMRLVREIASLAHSQRKTAGIPVRQPLSCIKVVSSFEEIGEEFQKLLLDEINVKRLEWVKEEGDIHIELNIEVTDELRKEGEARRIVRLIQKMRREAGVGLTEKIEVGLTDWPEEFEELIKTETLAVKLIKADKPFVVKA